MYMVRSEGEFTMQQPEMKLKSVKNSLHKIYAYPLNEIDKIKSKVNPWYETEAIIYIRFTQPVVGNIRHEVTKTTHSKND